MTDDRALTLVEVVVAVALSAFLIGSLVWLRPPSDALRAAGAVQAFALSARIEAVRRGAPVAVVYDRASRRFEMRSGDGGTSFGDPCAGPVLRHLDLDRFRRVSLLRPLRDDLVWLPTGVGRTCSGSGVIAGTLEFGARRPEQRLVVSSAGRIRREAVE